MRICIFAILIPGMAFASFEKTQAGARPAALSNAFVALADDPWAVLFNPAGMVQISSVSFSVFHSPRPFGLSELSTSAAAAVFPTHAGPLGFAVRRYGFNLYHELSATAAFAVDFGASAGIGLNLHSVTIRGYGSAASLALDAGLLIPFENLHWGIFFKNVNAARIGVSREPLDRSLTTGLAYSPSADFSAVLDFQKDLSFRVSPRAGFEYRPAAAIAIRWGASDSPAEISAGIGIGTDFARFDYAFASHELGGTHEASLTLFFR